MMERMILSHRSQMGWDLLIQTHSLCIYHALCTSPDNTFLVPLCLSLLFFVIQVFILIYTLIGKKEKKTEACKIKQQHRADSMMQQYSNICPFLKSIKPKKKKEIYTYIQTNLYTQCTYINYKQQLPTSPQYHWQRISPITHIFQNIFPKCFLSTYIPTVHVCSCVCVTFPTSIIGQDVNSLYFRRCEIKSVF